MAAQEVGQRAIWGDGADRENQKESGAYYTPDDVVRSLVKWTVRRKSDRMLDPACGDGRFLACHPKSVGVEQDAEAAAIVHQRCPGSLLHEGDFFSWALETKERFECAAGNPPFIRYQRFAGEVRDAARALCLREGADFSALSSSWAPFLVATASLLKPGGRMAFVVPAEIGHAPYAAPVLEYMTRRFDQVQVIAVREKLFPELSEDCWLFFASGYGGGCSKIVFTAIDRFERCDNPPDTGGAVPMAEWRLWNGRLRPFLLPKTARELYRAIAQGSDSRRLGAIAKVGIGYVTGANDFFHLRPSDAERARIPARLLHPAVRNGRSLARGRVDRACVAEWLAQDEQVLLLRLDRTSCLSGPVQRYLDSSEGRKARRTYKCQNRDPWYSVPDVSVPDGFLSYMSGTTPAMVSNDAGCVCTNSVHAVRLLNGMSMKRLAKVWENPLTELSCEVEGHPLGGGMLKVEPREAANVLVSDSWNPRGYDRDILTEATAKLRHWRHHGG